MFNDHDLLDFLLLATGVLATSTLMFAVLWLRSRERALRTRLALQNPEAVREDVARLVQAVDAIAIEVERISEAQRFTALTLAERSVAAGAGKRVPERVITPH
jgi:hypothetical protein